MQPTLPPGPPLPSFLQEVLVFSHPEPFLRLCQRRYGSRFTLRFPRLGTFVYLTDPADIRTVFRGDTDTFHAGEANGLVLGDVLGPRSVLVTDGDTHRRQRRLMMPAFHGDSVAALAAMMAQIAADDIRSWPVGRPFPAWPRMQRITLEVILRTVIGADDEQRVAHLREVLPPLVDLNLISLLQYAYPGLRNHWPWKKFRAIEARANAALHAEIARCQQDPALGERRDVLAMLVRARDEDGSAMTADELRDQLVTLLLAGHETTATGLAWALERLTRHPQVLAKAQRAAREDDHRYLDAVVAETLRARPVVPDVSRRLTRPAEVGGHLLPAGVMVEPAILMVQGSAEHYREPFRFDPERFAGQPPDSSVWLPFGGGNRRCLGAAFASTEMRVVLREILRRTDLATTAARAEPAKVRHVTLTPRKGARITIHRHLPVPAPIPHQHLAR
jgi:cytochrome P450 family 135